MDYQNQILSFLRQTENLPIALEVVKHVDDLRQHLHKTFWDDIASDLDERLRLGGYAARWKIIQHNGSYSAPWFKTILRPQEIPENFTGSYLNVALEQSTKNAGYGLYYGLNWSDISAIPDGAAYQHLLEKSKAVGFPEKGSSPWWLTIKYLTIQLQSDDFLLHYGPHPEAFIDEVAGEVWGYFKAIEPELYQFNQNQFESQRVVGKGLIP